MKNTFGVLTVVAASLAGATCAHAQQAGETDVRVAISRTKLVDKGEIYENGVLDPGAGYSTRATHHATLAVLHYVFDGLAVEAAITTPATTDNTPAGSLAGTPNLGDDEFITGSLGLNFHPLKGRFQPYVGGGVERHFTTQQRDGLGVGLNIASAWGGYVKGGLEYQLTNRVGVFVEVKKAFTTTTATGLLPLDATYTRFASIVAKPRIDPFTISVGASAYFGKHADADTSSPAITEDTTKWTIRAGLSSLELADKVNLNIGGAPTPGAALSTREHFTPSIQIGRYLTKNIALNATLGLPPTIDIFGGGTIGGVGKLGKVTYGPTAFTVQYHFTRSGRIRPYVGAGLSYMIVFGSKDAAITNLKIGDDVAPAFEIGTDLMVDNSKALFIDVKKALLRPSTYGSFGGAPVVGKTQLDPWVFSTGMAFHF